MTIEEHYAAARERVEALEKQYPADLLKAYSLGVLDQQNTSEKLNPHKTWPMHAEEFDSLVGKSIHLNRMFWEEAWADVLEERYRQVDHENWTLEHDDKWVKGELAVAGGCYALATAFYHADPHAAVLTIWPWSEAWLKTTHPRRDLIKAAALILAEIERLDRRDARKDQP